MLQTLLEGRFKVKFHITARQVRGFALLVGKNGSKLQEAKDDEVRKVFLGVAGLEGPNAVASAKVAMANKDKSGEGTAPMIPTRQKLSTSDIANQLGFVAGGPVVDETNLKRLYDFTLEWESGQPISRPLQEQLGLRLESRTITVKVLIIDSAETPVHPLEQYEDSFNDGGCDSHRIDLLRDACLRPDNPTGDRS
jgi:uncharacterized protein (TIGR03435 family)